MATSAKSPATPVSSARRPLATTVSEKIAEGQRLKDEGLRLLKEDKGKKAAVKFKTCFAYTKGLLPRHSQLAQYATLTGQQIIIDSEQQVAVREVELACNEGLATVYFRRAGSGDHLKALGYSEKVLVSDPDNVKGLFRAGQLHLRLKNIDEAKRCLTKAAKKEPHNVAIRTELRNLSKLAHEYGVDGVTGASLTGGSESNGFGSQFEISTGASAKPSAVAGSMSRESHASSKGSEHETSVGASSERRQGTGRGGNDGGGDGAGGGKRRRDDRVVGKP